MKVNNLIDTTDEAVNREGRKQLPTEKYACIVNWSPQMSPTIVIFIGILCSSFENIRIMAVLDQQQLGKM